MASLTERLDRFPDAWKPAPGDKLVGTVAEVDVRDGGYGEYPLLVVTDDDGEDRAFHAFHTVAARELARQRPEVGDRIGVAYHGRHERGYESYRVIVERQRGADAGPDWDAIGAAAEAELGDGDATPPPVSAPPPGDDDVPLPWEDEQGEDAA